MLMAAAVSLKHEGFEEEREWRIVHSPKRDPSRFLVRDTKVIAGIPQFVYKIPLKNNQEEGITGIEPAELIDRVIIGPSAFPWPLYEAFADALEKAGVQNAASKVVVSGIPLRM